MASNGRPPKYANADLLEKAVNGYFDAMDIQGRPYTLIGLVAHLGFSDRNSLYDLEGRKELEYDGDAALFSSIMQKARYRIESQRAEALVSGKGSPVGNIFYLKNCHGWVDKHEVQQDNRIVLSWGTDYQVIDQTPLAAIDIIDAKNTTEMIEE